MHKLVQRVVSKIDHLNQSLGLALSWLIPLIICFEALFFLLNKIYNLNLDIKTEAGLGLIFLSTIMLMLSVGYTLLQNHHFSFRQFEKWQSLRTKYTITLLASFILMLPLAFALFGFSTKFILTAWQETSTLTLLPVFKTLIWIYAYLLALTALSHGLKAALELHKDHILNKREPRQNEEGIYQEEGS